DNRRFAYNSFLEFLKSIYEQLIDYRKEINLENVTMSMDYKKRNSKNLKEMIQSGKEIISVSEIEIPQEMKTKEKFSKSVHEILNKDQIKSMEFGKEVHRVLEYLDFNHPNLEHIASWLSSKIKTFLHLPLLSKREEATIYKEYEFVENKDGKEYHGIIDLMLVYEDHVDIIDYKLKKIADEEYQKQLEGYQSYIQSITNKKTNIYLYSILDEKLTQL
ncbi:MAG: hypothetical protein K2I72_00710, partial [Bacilli bacterium]|nr:hypothetical protein [Bacilli bacterium]